MKNHDSRVCKCCTKAREDVKKMARMLDDEMKWRQALEQQLEEVRVLLSASIRHTEPKVRKLASDYQRGFHMEGSK
jgi:flagellar motor switch protein FliM